MPQSKPRGQAGMWRVFWIGLRDKEKRELQRLPECAEKSSFIGKNSGIEQRIDESAAILARDLERLNSRSLISAAAFLRGIEHEFFDWL